MRLSGQLNSFTDKQYYAGLFHFLWIFFPMSSLEAHINFGIFFLNSALKQY